MRLIVLLPLSITGSSPGLLNLISASIINCIGNQPDESVMAKRKKQGHKPGKFSLVLNTLPGAVLSMKAPMGDGLRPSVDDTPVEQLYDGVAAGKARALEFMGRDAPPIVDSTPAHLDRKYCAECGSWRPEHDFSAACSWLCTKHWKIVKAERNRTYYRKSKGRGRA